MSHYDEYLWCRIAAFCQGTDQQIGQTRQALFSVCKKWRNEIKLHLWAHRDVVQLLLQDPRVDPAADNNYAIRWASTNGHPRVDPSAENNLAIRLASRQGDFDVIQLLLQDPRVHPSAADNHAMC